MRALFPHTVFRTSSPYNTDIRVVEEWGGRKLLVNGSRQSGPYIRGLWQKAFRAFRLDEITNLTRILVLGLGGGTVIEMLRKRYPTAIITAVDIDPVMIAIAKQYFGIGTLPRVRLICADAKTFVKKPTKPFDLVIVDVFFGRHIPGFVETKQFWKAIRARTVMLNYLRELAYREKSDALYALLGSTFGAVRDFSIANNRFFLARS